MHRIDTPTAQKDKFGAGKNGFTKGDPQTGTPATEIDETILDAVQEEICAVIEGSGSALSKDDKSQLLKSINKLIYRKTKYGCPLIGELIHWPHQLMPHEIFTDIDMTFIPYIGQAFDKSRFPLLAMIHPNGVLPADMRGEFARGLDNGRGIDSGRVLMSAQSDAIRNITGFINLSGAVSIPGATGAFYLSVSKDGQGVSGTIPNGITDDVFFDVSRVVPTAGENRPRNIPWNMAVRAA